MIESVARRLVLPLHEAVLGRSTFRILRELRADPVRDAGRQSEVQRAGLRASCDRAAGRIPYWRERLADAWPAADPLQALGRVPVLTRAEVARNRDAMRWADFPGKVLHHRSGGTTDDNLDFYWGRTRQSWDRAMRYRGLERLGVFPGDRVLHVWPGYARAGRWPVLAAYLRGLRDWLANDIVLDPRPLTLESLDATLAYWRSYAPRAVVAYPSWFTQLARRVHASGRPFSSRGLRVLLCTGEPLFDFQRRLLEETFGVRVAQEYGSQDAGVVAQEDTGGVLRLNGEQMVVEVLRDGLPAAPGELGELIVTHFFTEVMPFVRYATGDVVRQPAAGRAGLTLALFPIPEGRTSDQLVTTDGRVQALRPVVEGLVAEPGYDEFSLFQPEAGALTVLEVEGRNRGERGAAEEVLRTFLGRDLGVEWRAGRRFAPSRSGKWRYACSLAALRLLAHDRESGAVAARAWPQRLLGP